MLVATTQLHILLIALTFVAIGSSIASDAAKQPKETTKSSEIVITFQRFVTEYGERHAEFTVSNATPRSIWFTGYSLQSPLYRVEHLNGARWVKKDIGWCGTGREQLELRSHERTTFIVYINSQKSEHNQTMRVGVWFSSERGPNRSGEYYWSEKVSPPKDDDVSKNAAK